MHGRCTFAVPTTQESQNYRVDYYQAKTHANRPPAHIFFALFRTQPSGLKSLPYFPAWFFSCDTTQTVLSQPPVTFSPFPFIDQNTRCHSEHPRWGVALSSHNFPSQSDIYVATLSQISLIHLVQTTKNEHDTKCHSCVLKLRRISRITLITPVFFSKTSTTVLKE